MEFIDVDVRGGDWKEIAEFSAKLGFKGICVILSEKEWNSDVKNKKEDGVFFGVEITGKNKKEFSRKARMFRDADVIIGYGKNAESSRAVLETKEIDILRQEPSINFSPLFAKLSKENNIYFEFRFSNILHSHKKERAKIFGNYMEAAKLIRKFGSRFVITSGAETKWDIRAPSEYIAFGRLLGFQDPHIKQALSGIPLKERIKKRSEKCIMPGVEIVD